MLISQQPVEQDRLNEKVADSCHVLLAEDD